MGLGANPIRPKWSITSDASICPAITLTMKLAAPSLGVNTSAAVR